jgi:hypothetical protein
MPKGTQFAELAAQAARNIEVARSAGEQMSFLIDPLPAPPSEGGRPPRGKGKVTSQLRDWCAAKGYRMPEDVLIQMAGMASTEDVFLWAMQRTEQVLAWAEAGARKTVQVIKDGPARGRAGHQRDHGAAGGDVPDSLRWCAEGGRRPVALRPGQGEPGRDGGRAGAGLRRRTAGRCTWSTW